MKLLKIILPINVKDLSTKERLLCCLFYIFCPIIPLLILYLKYYDYNLLLLAVSIIVSMTCISFPIFIYERWDEEYGVYSSIRLGSSYQFMAKYLPLFAPGLIALSLSLSYILNNLTLGMFVSLSFIIPSLIFFRSGVFNDENCLVDKEIVFGYPTGIYAIMSQLFGLYGFYNAYLVLNTIYNTIFLVIITIIFQVILLFPEVMNRYLPIDIRLKKYFLLVISILTLIFLSLVYSLQNQIIFNINVVSFVRLFFIISLSLILCKWYLSKKK